MNALILSGSRNPKGQTAHAAEALAGGLHDSGAEVETLFLPNCSLERCRQCEDSGWGICRSKGECIIEDDFASLVAKIRQAEVVVFATPVYFGDLAESLRAFLDRLRRTCVQEKGREGIAGKTAAAICVAGGGGGGAPNCCVSVERVLNICRMELYDTMPIRRQNLSVKMPALHQLGRALAAEAS